MDQTKIEELCEKCAFGNSISLELDSVVCDKCGHFNVCHSEVIKLAPDEIKKKIKRGQFKSPQNN
ncbi:MAG: hypothetical protein ACR2GD_01420 [Pyrinomonadaceae bacterium]